MAEDISSFERLAPYYKAARQETLPHQLLDSEELLGVSEALKSVFAGPGLAEALTATSDVAVIAEHKRRSPSEGEIRPDSTVKWTVEQYRKGGAAALSILTQNKHFGGFVSDIADAWEVSSLPILRKDFIDDEYQLHQAKAHGAAAALLIVAGLADAQLRNLLREAEQIELECLVEVHDKDELRRALKLNPPLLGINNRNLGTLQVDLGTTRELAPLVPDGILVVAESGYSVRNPDHIRELRNTDAVDGVLVGTDLMLSDDPAAALAAWLATDRTQ